MFHYNKCMLQLPMILSNKIVHYLLSMNTTTSLQDMCLGDLDYNSSFQFTMRITSKNNQRGLSKLHIIQFCLHQTPMLRWKMNTYEPGHCTRKESETKCFRFLLCLYKIGHQKIKLTVVRKKADHSIWNFQAL